MIRFTLALFLFLNLALWVGCSKVETGLTFAPRIATSRIDDAFDFNSDKLTTIRKQIDSDIHASKKNLAIKIASHIESVEKQSQNPNLTKAQVIAFFDEISETQTALLKSFAASAELVFKDISDHEIKSFKEYSDKKYEEELELAKDASAFKKKKLKLFVRNYEIFLGDISLEQENIISAFIDKNKDYFAQRILARQKFSEEFYLKVKAKDPVLDFFLTHYSGKKFAEIPDPAMKEYFSQLFDLQTEIWKKASDKQKAHLRKTLANYKEEFKKIAAKSN
jgi:hypothetical protein